MLEAEMQKRFQRGAVAASGMRFGWQGTNHDNEFRLIINA